MTKRSLVIIDWVDSHSGHTWQPLGALAKAARPVFCRSVGWLVSKAKDTTVLVAHIAGEQNGDLELYGTGDMAIPTKAIVKIQVISESTTNPTSRPRRGRNRGAPKMRRRLRLR